MDPITGSVRARGYDFGITISDVGLTQFEIPMIQANVVVEWREPESKDGKTAVYDFAGWVIDGEFDRIEHCAGGFDDPRGDCLPDGAWWIRDKIYDLIEETLDLSGLASIEERDFKPEALRYA